MDSDFDINSSEIPTPAEAIDRLIEAETQLVTLQEKVEALDTYYQGLFPAWEAKLESAEHMTAAILQGYAELSVNVQSIMDVMFSNDEHSVILKESLAKNRAKMFEVLQSDGPT
jgi:hypothetical protein